MSALLWLLTLFATTADSAQVSVDTIDGRQLQGDLSSITDAGVVIETSHGEARLTTRELVGVTLDNPPQPSAARLPQLIVFTDDGQLRANDLTLADGKVRFSTKLSAQPLETSRSVLHYVQFGSLPPGNESFWDELAEKRLAGDVLVVKKRGGESLDFLTGVVEAISAESIDFQWDGETIPVKRDKIAGILFFQKPQNSTRQAVANVHFRDGSQLPIVELASTPQSLQLSTLAGLKLATPLSQVVKFDFSLGKLVYLSDLKPLASRWTPLVALPTSVELLKRSGQPRFDRSFTDAELTLKSIDEKTHKPRLVASSKGIALRSRAELIYQIPAGMRRFRALAGINPATASQGNVLLEISDRDSLLWQGEIDGVNDLVELDLDVAGVKRLRIFVDYGKNLDYGDQLHLLNARVTK